MPENANILLADVLVAIHLAFVAFVVLGQLLILVGWLAGWGWVRNFYFRSVHLLCIAFVAAEGLVGMMCPLTRWEDQLRGELFNLEGASWLGSLCNHILYVRNGDITWFQRGHIAFGLLVLLTFLAAPPRLPRFGKRKTAPPPQEPADPAPQMRNGTVTHKAPSQSPISR